ncbi:hypothetical protein IPC42_22680, partial [Pseudomonas aeruginosa]
MNQLKASVLRDLAWLFNTTSLFDHGPAARMPAGNSVLNYGLPALAGHTASVKFITDKEAPLMARIKAEGANTPADLLLTVDAGNLWQAEQMGLLQPFKSATIERNIPSQYRSSTDSWTGL